MVDDSGILPDTKHYGKAEKVVVIEGKRQNKEGSIRFCISVHHGTTYCLFGSSSLAHKSHPKTNLMELMCLGSLATHCDKLIV
ncbi:hypothetical protein Ccrd_002143 [Cynara cardunculus var. scolymus]|uniref:Uncharacterized protein n=1 Tax=Cynara cardunculus var. scolymus TaxID=59895 RepID=A0A103XRX2_CYNCS|nr:hypothetical protein Ccrd_002143 [Cynara cardunculus var. scolymus]